MCVCVYIHVYTHTHKYIHIHICRVAGPGPAGSALPLPDCDLVLGIWRLPFQDFDICGDLKSHACQIKAIGPICGIEAGVAIAELLVDISGSKLVGALSMR